MKKMMSLILILSIVSGCASTGKTNHTYLLPNGYEGSFTVLFNIPGAPRLQTEGDSSIIPFETTKIEALQQTDYGTYAYAVTSRVKPYDPEADYYEDTNQFYYVNESGERKPIDPYCTHADSYGSWTGSSGKKYSFITLQVTSSQCSEYFHVNGNENYKIQSKEAENYFMNEFD
ncbi:hypothetical protein Q73_10815 [Bacillus coahuilensis m2-6]|uniref:DUF6843 domain-containing protein n=1 Tax=Bacillus coahuilensis TaxID=408580 RepID=UPI0007500EDA|nr:hypothetical protein [Bacillus coahuilensis]KUP06641.1 hypothetical protein Q73_10815 [Bacillus coahuilensis m2-6]